MITLKLELSAAKQCFEYTQKVRHSDSYEWLRDLDIPERDLFMSDMDGFIDYMKICINSEFEVIEIPERYYRIFTAITQVGLVTRLFGRDGP